MAGVGAENLWFSGVREDFPILEQKVHGLPLVYLDNAATSHKPRAVIDAMTRYYEHDNSNVHRGVHELSQRATVAFEEARDYVAKFVNARSSNEIIFTRGTTEGINLVAHTWGAANLKQGDTILLTEMEHHSNIVPWQLLAKRTGAKLAYVPVTTDGRLDIDYLDKALTTDVKLLSLTHISNTLGTINPIKDICAKARRAGIVTVIDAAQSGGHVRIDVQDIGCDFLALSGHKMCGPMGIGALFGRSELLEAMPPFHGGGDMIAHVDFYSSTWKQPPHKFEAGTPNVAGSIGLKAAMEYLDGIGRENIAQHDFDLSNYAYVELEKVPGVKLFGPKTNRAGLVSFLVEGIHAHDVVTMADQRGLALRGGNHCNQPLMQKLGVESTIRASFYFYNTRDEVDFLVESLREIQRFFGVS